MGVRPRMTAFASASGRHRLPRHVKPAATDATAPITVGGTPDVTGDGEPAHTSASGEGPADVNARPESNSSSTDLPGDSRVWARLIAGVLLPALSVLLGGGSGCLAWEMISERLTQQARIESVHAATDGISALLAYNPDTAEKSLSAACELLTGKFKASYAVFTHQHVIPNARERHITSVVTVPAAASVQATIEHAVVMVFVNQTFIRDPDPPKSTASDVRVALEKVGHRWLISDFTPVR